MICKHIGQLRSYEAYPAHLHQSSPETSSHQAFRQDPAVQVRYSGGPEFSDFQSSFRFLAIMAGACKQFFEFCREGIVQEFWSPP